MWSPTHVQVLVKRAKGLNIKGKNGTNDAFVTISLGKEKYQTTVKEKCSDPVEWNEQCELPIPLHGNVADIHLSVLHRNFLGVDEFLGQASLPLADFDVYERPKSRALPLKCKPGKNKNQYRGEIEVKVGFTVKATANLGGSAVDLSKKNKGSISSLNKISSSISGSLMSLGKREKKSIKQIFKSVTPTQDKLVQPPARLSPGKMSIQKQLSVLPESNQGNEDPGVNSEDDDDDDYDAEIQRLQSPDLVESDGAEENQRSSQRLPPLNEDECSVFSQDSQQTKKKESDCSRIGSQSSLPSYNEATSGIFTQNKKETKKKKKIIPVQSDFESSSPSPEPGVLPASLSPVPPAKTSIRMSQSSVNLARSQAEVETDRTKKTLGKKLKNSYSFRDHTELVGRSLINSKPSETTPAILPRRSLPHDVLAQYNGKTREDLIEMVINLQKTVDLQGKKMIDLEDYIDNLLIKVLDVAPILLKQDSPLISKHSIL